MLTPAWAHVSMHMSTGAVEELRCIFLFMESYLLYSPQASHDVSVGIGDGASGLCVGAPAILWPLCFVVFARRLLERMPISGWLAASRASMT